MAPQDDTQSSLMSRLPFFGTRKAKDINPPTRESDGEDEHTSNQPPKWSFGVLNDKNTIEVPGSVLLLADHRNEPLGLRNAPARTSHSSIPVSIRKAETPTNEKKKTSDGKIILEPQPEDVPNDPLNWPNWRRDAALLSIGIYCMLGGGQTSVLAAGFTNVAEDYGVPVSKVSLTTGLYMMGLGIGSVIASPTAILWGKRPVYLVSALCFIITSVWCALSPNYASLIVARIFQGMSVSPVECLPSATVAEIFFLHERAFRLGIYTLLLLGGKNLVPLVAAVVVQNLSWRWVFWVVALVVAFCSVLLFLFVSESFWLRVPHGKTRTPSRPGLFQRVSSRYLSRHERVPVPGSENTLASPQPEEKQHRPHKDVHFSTGSETETVESQDRVPGGDHHVVFAPAAETVNDHTLGTPESTLYQHKNEKLEVPRGEGSPDEPPVPSPKERQEAPPPSTPALPSPTAERPSRTSSIRSYLPWSPRDPEKRQKEQADLNEYVEHWREREAKSFIQQLRPWHGRLNKDSWLKVMVRPFILFAYPAVLWSSAIYACSVGWLIVVSESVAVIYREKYYHFNALGVGLIYISPFVGGILGTAVAGKVSDIFVKAMAKRNGGLYEPEFRLIMALPIGISTVIGLMGFGWSAEKQDHWIVPTVFLGVISFGCCLGSTTSITFCVDSYRQYAGEALVTLNFSKNILHGLVFSLFVTEWLETDGSKSVFIWLGVIQLILVFTAAPLYVYGKRLRMWTLRSNFMEKF
ncbi:MFS transporter [Diaporthe sp. PMI_573]|nr:MFS transporter [Diaporthaceae sp. PMI_573]